MNRFRTAGRIALATVLSAGLLLTACGDDEDSKADGTTTTEEASSTTEEETSETTAVEDGTLEVELVDYAFENLPESVPAGTKLEIKNSSEAEFHELVAFLLPEDETRSVEDIIALPEEELGAIFSGPPATVLLAGPDGGEQSAAVGDGTLNEPGRYLLMCSIPTGADPEVYADAAEGGAPPAEDPNAGPPHFVHGMHAELVVE